MEKNFFETMNHLKRDWYPLTIFKGNGKFRLEPFSFVIPYLVCLSTFWTLRCFPLRTVWFWFSVFRSNLMRDCFKAVGESQFSGHGRTNSKKGMYVIAPYYAFRSSSTGKRFQKCKWSTDFWNNFFPSLLR